MLNLFYIYSYQILKKFLLKIIINDFYLTFILRSLDYLMIILNFLKLHSYSQYTILTDIVCIDYYNLREKRFALNYNLLSLKNNSRIIVSIALNNTSLINSSVNTYSSSNWFEREIWDLYGIFFINHPDLRRILTDYGFQGYPLRKDFPLNGYVEIRYDEEYQYLVYEPIELMQNIRYYDFINPFYKNYLT